MKLCPKCGAELTPVIGGYLCHECGGGMFSEDEVIIATCPTCNNELGELGDDYYCFTCSMSVRKEDAIHSKNISSDDDYNFEESDYDFGEPDYDSMIDNGENICLNCTYWSVSPYGAAHGMVCRRGNPTSGPGDSCSSFVQSHYFASYGNEGQYQFDETRRNTVNKLYHWRNNR